MTERMNELLAVLDMPETEQWKRLRPFTDASGDDYERGLYSKCLRKRVLADLAFRLRDEAIEKYGVEFHNGIYAVQCYLKKEEWATAFWGEVYAQPIHWIIAGLIAKELEKK